MASDVKVGLLMCLFVNLNVIHSFIKLILFLRPGNICKIYDVALVLKKLETPDLSEVLY